LTASGSSCRTPGAFEAVNGVAINVITLPPVSTACCRNCGDPPGEGRFLSAPPLLLKVLLTIAFYQAMRSPARYSDSGDEFKRQ